MSVIEILLLIGVLVSLGFNLYLLETKASQSTIETYIDTVRDFNDYNIEWHKRVVKEWTGMLEESAKRNKQLGDICKDLITKDEGLTECTLDILKKLDVYQKDVEDLKESCRSVLNLYLNDLRDEAAKEETDSMNVFKAEEE